MPGVWKADSWTLWDVPVCNALKELYKKCQVLGYYHLAGRRRVHIIGLTKLSSRIWLPVLKKERKIMYRIREICTPKTKSYRWERKHISLLKDEGICPSERLLSSQSQFLNPAKTHNRQNPDWAKRKISNPAIIWIISADRRQEAPDQHFSPHYQSVGHIPIF